MDRLVFGFLVLVIIQTASAGILINNDCIRTEERCPNENVTFWLYTRDTQNSPTQLSMFDPDSIKNAKFIKDRPLIILIHGYTGHKDYAPNPSIRPAYFENGEYNIISIAYNPIAREPCYLQAVANLPTVANCTAQIIDHIVKLNIIPFENIHVIGFSLGGQTAGIVANYLKSGKLKRITGLDPAKPLFITAPKDKKLDQSDAEFVQVIHTDAFRKGMLVPMGHVDFYLNGGVEQPGCEIQTDVPKTECNHNRAPKYYAESINSKVGFWGFQCAHWHRYILGMCSPDDNKDDSLALMGMNTPNTTRGMYFLKTNADPPYAKGQNVSSNSIFRFFNKLKF